MKIVLQIEWETDTPDVLREVQTYPLGTYSAFATTFHRVGPKPLNCLTLMQYTGLKDKNGKEIYEGDIVSIQSSWKDVILDDGSGPLYDQAQLVAVEMKNGCWGADMSKDELFTKRFYSFDEIQTNIIEELPEVIGNIYENKEE